MDRVLLIIDDIQYAKHIEMTLRKVGFDVEAISSEYQLAESLLVFNPDYIICRGHSNRFNTLNIGKKLKETTLKAGAKTILIFSESFTLSSDEQLKIKCDVFLNDPISTLKLALRVFAMTGQDIELIKDKLLKFAFTDNQFRNYEQQILKRSGMTLDREIQIVSAIENQDLLVAPVIINDSVAPIQPIVKEVEPLKAKPAIEPQLAEDVSPEALKQIHAEILEGAAELNLRIERYNRLIKNIDQDLKKGLNKRQVREINKKLMADLQNDKTTDINSIKSLNDEKLEFAKELFKKGKGE